MLLTRPDIAFTIQQLSIALLKPYIKHLQAAKNLLRYLKGTYDLAISYTGYKNTLIANTLIGYCDSDFARDKATSKLTYIYLFSLAGGPISQKSKRASTIALSTLEAEADAISEAIREASQLKNFFKEIKTPLKLPIQLYNDN